MGAPWVSFRGEGWGLLEPVVLGLPVETLEVPADRPDLLGSLLARLDEISSCGDRDALAAGFLTYEAGVWLEGSEKLFRPPERTPLAAFSVYSLSAGAGSAEATPPQSVRGRGNPIKGEEGSLSPEAWGQAVAEIRDGIARGDVYQVNLTRRTTLVREAEVARLAGALFADNPVPYAFSYDGGPWAVVSNSPELFLRVDLGAGTVESGPIKGTIASLPGEPADRLARAELLSSEKDAAEHVMIVDLVRNDLGRVSRPLTVRVPRLRSLLTFRHLPHLESLVTGELRPGVRLSDVLLATLPAGSITGAPKRASLGFIRRLEPVARGPYTGAAGYVRGDGRAVFNVAIRTAIVSAAGVDYHAGGGIVWDSDAGREWAETETKSREFQRVSWEESP